MPLPSPNKLLARLLPARVVRDPRRYWPWYCVIGLLVTVIVGVLFHGCERREIIRPTPQMGIESQFWVRVLLANNATECTVSAPSPVRLLGPGAGTASPGAELSSQTLDETTKVVVSGRQLMLGTASLGGNEVTLSPNRPHVFTFNGRDYRGKLRLTLNTDGRTFDAINFVPLEPYLAGVVGAEMPDYWEPEALKAQTIAARTYCLHSKNRFGVHRAWDVSKTQASQVYLGIEAESAQVWSAVNATAGRVLVAPNSQSQAGISAGIPGLFPTYYSSVCGGHTENSARVFGDSFGPLRGVPCPYCQDVARLSLFFWPMAQLDRATVTERLVEKYPTLTALGSIAKIVATQKSNYGEFLRLTQIKLIGTTGKTDVLRAEDLRLSLDPSGRKIKSTACQIVEWGDGWAFLSGRGWGHGVGLCQYGAEGMARTGRRAEEILAHYYPGAKIVSLY